jgi:hypothetical protein
VYEKSLSMMASALSENRPQLRAMQAVKIKGTRVF